MKAIQRGLNYPVLPSRSSKEDQEKSRKHNLILGRPRRLKASFPTLTGDDWAKIDANLHEGMTPEEAVAEFAIHPEVIKISLTTRTIETLDRIRTRMAGGATRPDLVRMAVQMFVNRNEHLIGSQTTDHREKRKSEDGRCNYVKIPFEPEVAQKIGHQEWDEGTDANTELGAIYVHHYATGLCAVFGLTRQQVISRAIEEFLREMR